MRFSYRLALVSAAILVASCVSAQTSGPGNRAGNTGGNKRDAARFNQPPDVQKLSDFSVVLGRPTGSSIAANLLSERDADCYIEYGAEGTAVRQRSALTRLFSRRPAEIEINGLAPATSYQYRVICRSSAGPDFSAVSASHFQTQRLPGQPFIFEMQGDSHPERPQQFDAELYAQTLRSVAKDRPDFYITMGDDFSVDTLDVVNAQTVSERYLLQRPYLALVGQSSPLFLVNGNHEQAASANLDGTPDNVAVWAQTSRNSFFPQPAPNSFYGGNHEPVPPIGLLRNYFSWTWGDALFMVIDPYWHSSKVVDNAFTSRDKGDRKLAEATKGFRDMWDITLGDAQYQWFKKTLETSKARFKFVFAHHVLGTGRGGIEQATLYEWGGNDRRGVNRFKEFRPTWELPIHQLMVKNRVSVFFQGHDHVFSHQVLDGVTYQTLPQPGDPNYATHYESAFRSGDLLPSSGRVRVTVDGEKARVEYVRSYLPKDVSNERVDQRVDFSYDVPAVN